MPRLQWTRLTVQYDGENVVFYHDSASVCPEKLPPFKGAPSKDSRKERYIFLYVCSFYSFISKWGFVQDLAVYGRLLDENELSLLSAKPPLSPLNQVVGFLWLSQTYT